MSKKLPPPAEWALRDAQAAVGQPLRRALGRDGLERRRAYIERGDHWQDGREWIGPRGTPETEKLVLDAVRPQFTPNDILGEGLDNAEDGLFTVEAALSFVPREPADPESAEAERQQAEADALTRDVSEWWDEAGLWEAAAAAYRYALWSTRGPIRLRIPVGLLASSEAGYALPQVTDWADALARIRVEAPAPDHARVYEDPDTLDRAAVFLYEDEGRARAELWVESGGTVTVRTLGEGEDGAPIAMPRGVRLPIVEIEAPLLVTDASLRQQQRANFFETMANRVAETAGWPERYFVNTDQPGLWQTTRPANGDYLDARIGEHGATEYKVPVPLALGASIANFLVGITYGEANDPQLAAPSIVFRDPTDPEYVTKLCRHARRTLLQAMKQGHMAGDTTAEASGVAYQQARSRFETWLRRRKAGVEGALRYVITAALALTEAMGAPAVLDRYRVRIDLTVNAGPVLPEQQRSTAELYAAGLRARATALAETGIEDTAAEEDAMEADPSSHLARMRDAAAAVEVLDRTEFAVPAIIAPVLRNAGWPIEDIDEYLTLLAEQRQAQPGLPGSGMGAGALPPIPGLEEAAEGGA